MAMHYLHEETSNYTDMCFMVIDRDTDADQLGTDADMDLSVLEPCTSSDPMDILMAKQELALWLKTNLG